MIPRKLCSRRPTGRTAPHRTAGRTAGHALLCSLALWTLWLLAPATAHAQDAPDTPNVPSLTGSIAGRVTDEAGEPLRNIEVRNRGSNGENYATTTDENGEYQFAQSAYWSLHAGISRSPA